MRRLILTALIVFINIAVAHAQTLKVTAVDASTTQLYNNTATNALGKNMAITVYDNSVSVKVANEKPVILKLVSDNNYSTVVRDVDTEIEIHSITLNRTVSVLTSAEYTVNINEKGGKYRRAWIKITAKRF